MIFAASIGSMLTPAPCRRQLKLGVKIQQIVTPHIFVCDSTVVERSYVIEGKRISIMNGVMPLSIMRFSSHNGTIVSIPKNPVTDHDNADSFQQNQASECMLCPLCFSVSFFSLLCFIVIRIDDKLRYRSNPLKR